MEPKELIYNVYKDIKNSFDLWCNSYKTILGLTPMTPGYVISMEYAPHIDIEEYFSEEFIEPSTVIARIRYLMEGCIDHKPTSLLKEYHIHLNAQPKESQENPFVTQILLISKKLTTITIK